MTKKLAILQSNYVPWRGYFDLIAAVDEFIVYDEAQYTKHDWRNRNLIKTPQGPQWLTVPVRNKGLLGQTVRAAEIDGSAWAPRHWKTLEASYGRARHFDEVAELLRPEYLEQGHRLLSLLNRRLIDLVCGYLGIATRITDARDYVLEGDKTGRLVALCEQADATLYVSGPTARTYLDEQRFAERGIGVQWFDYEGYADYPQLWGPFTPRVSVLDLMFNCGPQAADYLRHAKP